MAQQERSGTAGQVRGGDAGRARGRAERTPRGPAGGQSGSEPRGDESGAARRGQILGAAATVFAERGIHGARIDDVAAAAGVSKGTVYWYFRSKDEIVYTLLDDFFAGAHRDLVALQDEPGTVAERVEGYLLSFASVLAENRALAPLAVEFYALAPREPRVRDFLERYYAEYAEALAALIQQGNRRGELDVRDPRGAGRTLAELFDVAALLWILNPDMADLTRRLQGSFEIVYHGLAARSP